MKIFSICLIFLQYINIIFSVIPVWKIDSSTQILLNETGNFTHEYIVSSGRIDWEEFALKRRIYKDEVEGKIKQQNTLYINGRFFAVTPYEDIESMYINIFEDAYLVCPKGKFHVYIYSIINGENWFTLKPGNEVNEESNWDLKCYHQTSEDFLFVGYLNNEAKFYQIDFKSYYIIHSEKFENGLYAYFWN